MTPPWQESGPVIPSHGLSWTGFTYCPGRGSYSLRWHQLPEKTLSCGVWNVLLAFPDKLEVPKAISRGAKTAVFHRPSGRCGEYKYHQNDSSGPPNQHVNRWSCQGDFNAVYP